MEVFLTLMSWSNENKSCVEQMKRASNSKATEVQKHERRTTFLKKRYYFYLYIVDVTSKDVENVATDFHCHS